MALNAPLDAPSRVVSVASARRTAYPFADLSVGEAFDVADDKGVLPCGISRRQHNIQTSMYIYTRQRVPGTHFITRRSDCRSFVRVYRVA